MNFLRLPRMILLFFVLLGCTVSAVAQTVNVTGKVTDQQNGKPLAGVTVKIKNSTTATATTEDGSFSIKAPSKESVITFSYVGYGIAELKAGAGLLNVSLAQVDAKMDEVVVVGYGTKKRLNVLGSVATIKAEDIEDLPVANLGSALINRLPGVGVNFASGKPGSTTTITIRNPITFNGSTTLGATAEPLYVIDGIIVTKTDFDNLDASLVENMSFLKDASAAIYGAAGAKGVVLVTTKKGKPGKAKISYSGYFGTSDAATVPEVMSAYEHAKMLNDGYEINNSPLNSRFSQADLDSLKAAPSDWWYNAFWKPSTLTRHTMNVSGGTERITFFAGGNYYDETGNYGDISIKKYGIRSGMNAKITDNFTATVQLSSDFTRTNRNTLKGASDENDDLSIRALYLTPRWVPVEIWGKPVGWSGPNPPGNWNPKALFNSGNYKWNKSQGLSVNASLEWRPNFLKGLTARVQFGQLNRLGSAKEYFPPYTVYNFVRRGQNNLLFSTVPAATATSKVSNSDQLGQSAQTNRSYQLVGTLQYSKKFGQHDLDWMAAMDQSEYNTEEYYFYRNGQIINGIDQFWAFATASSVIRNPTYTAGGKRSYLSRLNYSYKGRYLLEAIARYDGSSNFAPENRWGLFPSVGLGWVVSDEPFFKNNITFISNLKLRANVGIVGEDRIKARQYEARYTQTTGMLFGTTVTNGLDPNIIPNPDIMWEKARNTNLGMDMALFNNKLNISVEVFRRYNYDGFDLRENSSLPYTVGVSTAVVNYGKALSWGSEYSIGYKDRFNKDWGFNMDLNFGFSNSQLLQSFYSSAKLEGSTEYEVTIGRSTKKYNSSNYGYISKGILRTQADVDAVLAKNPNYKIGGSVPQIGFLDFEDMNKDGVIDDKDIVPMFENTTSIVAFGFTFGLQYKTIKLQTNMNLAIGGKKFVDGEARKVPTTTQNAPAFWNDHWTPSNPNAKYPRADAPLAKENSTFWAVDGTQSRINNMTLSFGLPKRWSEKLHIPDFRGMITGTNLWTLYNPLSYKDPYTSNFAYYPTLRSISLGINMTL